MDEKTTLNEEDRSRIINAVIEIAKTGENTWTKGIINAPKYDSKSFRGLIEDISDQTFDEFCRNNYTGLIQELKVPTS